MTDYPGTRKRASWTVTDETVDPPVLTSPDAMTVTLDRPSGDPGETTYEYPDDAAIIEDAEGTFHMDIDCPVYGRYAIRVASTQGVVGVEEEKWRVHRSEITGG